MFRCNRRTQRGLEGWEMLIGEGDHGMDPQHGVVCLPVPQWPALYLDQVGSLSYSPQGPEFPALRISFFLFLCIFFGFTGSLLLRECFSLVAASRLLIAVAFLMWSTGSVLAGSVLVAPRL